jgi:hypothetical protein
MYLNQNKALSAPKPGGEEGEQSTWEEKKKEREERENERMSGRWTIFGGDGRVGCGLG